MIAEFVFHGYACENIARIACPGRLKRSVSTIGGVSLSGGRVVPMHDEGLNLDMSSRVMGECLCL